MCRAAGFARVETKVGPPPRPTGLRRIASAARRRITPSRYPISRYRLVVQAFT